MSVLSDEHILRLMRSGKLIVHPILDFKQISGGKIDLRLDNIIYIVKRIERPYYDPMEFLSKDPLPCLMTILDPSYLDFVLYLVCMRVFGMLLLCLYCCF